MPPKRRKQKGVRHDGTRWSSDANGMVAYKPVGSEWKRFRLKAHELDPEAATSARFAAASAAASPTAAAVDSPLPVASSSLPFEAAIASCESHKAPLMVKLHLL